MPQHRAEPALRYQASDGGDVREEDPPHGAREGFQRDLPRLQTPPRSGRGEAQEGLGRAQEEGLDDGGSLVEQRHVARRSSSPPRAAHRRHARRPSAVRRGAIRRNGRLSPPVQFLPQHLRDRARARDGFALPRGSQGWRRRRSQAVREFHPGRRRERERQRAPPSVPGGGIRRTGAEPGGEGGEAGGAGAEGGGGGGVRAGDRVQHLQRARACEEEEVVAEEFEPRYQQPSLLPDEGGELRRAERWQPSQFPPLSGQEGGSV
mmetsp:Transcript_32561/g.69331  ORF Transcript_32561/g.69331 Transcript_32561/m.69331 type:complete len:263 (+) Transcript_32561:163-951(+)